MSGCQVTFCAYDQPNNVGGPVTWLQRLLPALRNYGIESRCLFLLHHGKTGPAVDKLRQAGFDCPAVLCQPHTRERVRWVLEQLADAPCDVFIPNLVVAAYHASRWVRQAGIPTVGVLHSDDAFYRAIQDEFLFGKPRNAVSSIVCVSRQLEAEVMKRPGFSGIVRRISYGVPFPEAAVQNSRKPFRLAYVGRLAQEQKRIVEVARALCRVTREIAGVEAVLFGEGPQRPEVEQILAAESAGQVRLAGAVPSDQVQARLLECQVIVLLSDYEGLPIALLEAMACGCVPICTRMRSGIPELVQDGVTGLLVDDRENSFVNAIRRLQTEPGLWERLSSAARARVQSEFSVDACARQWAALLHELAGQSRGRRPIRVPRRISLPPVHPALASGDPRPEGPSIPLRLYRRSRMFAGRIKRQLLRQPIP